MSYDNYVQSIRNATDTYFTARNVVHSARNPVSWLNGREPLQNTGNPLIDVPLRFLRDNPDFQYIIQSVDNFYNSVDEFDYDIRQGAQQLNETLGQIPPQFVPESVRGGLGDFRGLLQQITDTDVQQLTPQEIVGVVQRAIPEQSTPKRPNMPVISEPRPSVPVSPSNVFSPNVPKGAQDPRVKAPSQPIQQSALQSSLGNYFGLQVEQGEPSFLQSLLLPLTTYDPLTLQPTNIRVSNQSVLKGIYNVGATIGRFI